MSNDFVATAVVPGLVGLIAVGYAYSAYWAFRIREALFDRLYRDRAQWVGIASVFVAWLAISYLLVDVWGPTNFYLSFAQFAVTDVAGIVTFAWVDTTIRTVRKFDPLRRNTLHWSRARWFLWFFVIVSTIGGLVSVIITGETYFSPQGGRSAIVQGPFGFATIGLIAVLLARRRSVDQTVREHLKWLSLYLFTVLVANGVTGGQYLASLDVLRAVSAAALAVGSLFVYRAARSVAPVSKLPVGTVMVSTGTLTDGTSSTHFTASDSSTDSTASSHRP